MHRDAFGPFEGRTWLNTAHQGALPRVAAAAAEEAIRWKQAPHHLSMDRFAQVPDRLRRALGRLLNVPADEVILANSSSHGIHLLANGIPWRPGDEVLLVRGDFPSTTLPWTGLESRGVRTRFIEPRGGVVTPEELEANLSSSTRVFCTTWVHSFSGHTVDVRSLGTLCREQGIWFVLNASQGIGARPLDVSEAPVDAISCVGFKWLCGPYGTGFCWIHPELRESLEVNRLYWLAFQGADDLAATTEALPEVADLGARRYDIFGTANFLNFVPWTAALELLLERGIEKIAAHDGALVDRLVDGLNPDKFELLSPRRGAARSTLVLVSHRDRRRNPELLERLRSRGVDISLRRGLLRVSPHLYNTPRDIDRALEALHDQSPDGPPDSTSCRQRTSGGSL